MRINKGVFAVGVALFGLVLAGCSSDGDNGASEGEVSSSNDAGENDAEDAGSNDAEKNDDGEISANVVFDGEEISFDEVFCNVVPGEGETRFLGFFDGGEVEVNESGGPDGSAVIDVVLDDGREYNNSVGPHADFIDGKINANIELMNQDEEKATVEIDITC